MGIAERIRNLKPLCAIGLHRWDYFGDTVSYISGYDSGEALHGKTRQYRTCRNCPAKQTYSPIMFPDSTFIAGSWDSGWLTHDEIIHKNTSIGEIYTRGNDRIMTPEEEEFLREHNEVKINEIVVDEKN